jgi:hypothetical protein
MTARSILKKMEATRDAALKGAEALAWLENFSVANSHSSVIIGILHSTIDADDDKIVNKVASIEDALYATVLLDTILQKKPALRNSFSCYRVIRLWNVTNSKEAGRRGEEILGRLEMSQLINCDPRSDQSSMRDVVLRSKQSMVENWSTSAAAGEPGAAKSASICLDRMKERLDYEIGSFDERSRRERGYLCVLTVPISLFYLVESQPRESHHQVYFDSTPAVNRKTVQSPALSKEAFMNVF